MTDWRLIDSGLCDAAYNMALDEAIAISVRNSNAPPTLRFYNWRCTSVSLGSFQKIADINIEYCINNNIPVVRRPTGGRGILHGDELTYSFSARNEGFFSGGLLETYHRLSLAFQSSLHRMGLKVTIKTQRESVANLTRSPLCFKSTSYGEISLDGKKLIGSAQKRWKDGFLQQGSIPYSIDYEKIDLVFKTIAPSLRQSKEILGLRKLIPNFEHEKFKEYIKSAFEEIFNITFIVSHPSPHEQRLALLLLSEKYQHPHWTLRTTKNTMSYNNNEISKKALQG
ncbi:lipoate--protein ligase family protein [Dissulfurispira thermophila]|uniref:lipoate--protein ligase family protein n=1 Tax=Dissulfurispira thermophila TaxID=2715679 RepID=UPI00193CB6C8|nr:biotin/lipoate A/B protein ligase family protein [Dissulfurispira thermophila]